MAYDQVLSALEMGQALFDGEVFHGQDPMTILQAVEGDNPELIWFVPSAFRRQHSLLGGSRILLSGVITGEERYRREQELETAVSGVINAIREENPMTDYDRLICLYEYLQRTVTYDQEAFLRRDSSAWSHNAYGALVLGKAVCDGISAALALVAQAMGYDATVVHGNAARDGMTEDHAWAMIRLKGQCCHLDPTWDMSKSQALGVCGYDYFCLDDGTIAMDHQWSAGIVPDCRFGALSWYHHNRCYANNLTQAREILDRYARSKVTVFRLRLADGVAVTGEEGTTMARMLMAALRAAGRSAAVRYLWNPYVRSLTATLGR